ncbi:MAG TPA: bile acid:sodium symporter family protein [Saprospiraceae bacterium]|nr:bile acid:sodium symporter family protein [Saprospiraceae bacterium]HPI05144.1 bile acid:sodium symporter family protein [Saprospiraceae bacterium]
MTATTIVDVAVGGVLGLVMFGVGLSLTLSDFIHIVKHPRAFFSALGAQMIGLPLIAFLICMVAPLPAEIKVGLIILSVSPGGATSGFLTYLWKGNVALSLSLTSVNSFLTLFSIPVLVNVGLRVFMGRETDLHLPFWETVSHIFFITMIPATLGLLLRRNFPVFAERISKPAKYVMLVLLGVVFTIKLFAGESHGGAGLNAHDFALITPFALLQNASCLFFGYFFMKWMGTPHASRITAAMESGVQNTTLAFLIASNMLGNQEMVKPALVYSLYSFWTACLFAYTANRLYVPE